MTDFEKIAGNAVKDRIARHVNGVVEIDREIENLKAQRKEALTACEGEDRLNGPAISALAKLHRTGSTSATAEVWPIVQDYAAALGWTLPSNPQLDLFGE